MDEIIIEEKKYISSKQAAKITGYAKDYIGQLCREGRVSARLVGRNWYVLQTAIQDHRFGDPEIEPEKEIVKSEETTTSAPKPTQDIQESWQAWFDRFDHKESAITEPGNDIKPEPEPTLEDATAIDIPIHVHEEHHTIPAELLPRHFEITLDGEEYNEKPAHLQEQKENKKSRVSITTLQVSGILLAVVTFAMAIIGSGYFDKYVLSNSQVRILAGVSVYNK
jgi:hypothetical protein